MDDEPHPVFVFDSACGLCSAFVQFVLRWDRSEQVRFLAAQSPVGQALYARQGLDPEIYSTSLLVDDGLVWTKSDGILRVFRHLPWPWTWVALLGFVPRAIRDRVYDVVARNRVRWFGPSHCALPGGPAQGRSATPADLPARRATPV